MFDVLLATLNITNGFEAISGLRGQQNHKNSVIHVQ